MSTMHWWELPPKPRLHIARRQMDHRAINAPVTARRTWGRTVPVAAAHQRTRPHTTNGKRTNHPDAPGNDTNGNTRPTARPQQNEHRQPTFGPPGGKNKTPTNSFGATPLKTYTKVTKQQLSGKTHKTKKIEKNTLQKTALGPKVAQKVAKRSVSKNTKTK